MMKNHTETRLLTLRSYASLKDWNECVASVVALLHRSSEETAVKVLVRQLRRFMSDLHRAHPDDWTIENAQSLLAVVTSWPELSESTLSVHKSLRTYSSQPGINNFRNALAGLNNLAPWKDRTDKPVERAADTLQGVLMAILDLNWGTRNPDLWRRSLWPQERRDWFIGLQFASDETTREMGRQLWKQVADDIEADLLP